MRILKLKFFVEVIRKKTSVSSFSDHVWIFVSSARKKLKSDCMCANI